MARKTVEKNIAYDDVKKKYYVNMDYGIDANGKQIKKSKTFGKLSDARKALKEYEADKTKGTLTIPKTITLKEWLEYYMLDIVKNNRAETTIYGYKNIINNHILPALGDIQIQQLKPQQIQKYYSILSKKKLSNNTIRKHHDFLKTSLNLAVKQDILLRNPVDRVEAPKVSQNEIDFYSPNDLKQLFILIEGNRLEVVVKLAGYLGLRREEICGLKWDSIDFENKEITIKDARTMAGSTIVEKETKNKSSTRTLHMADDLIELLKYEQVKQQEAKEFYKGAYDDNGLVVVWDNGKPYRPNYISELFTKFIKDNSLPKLTLHGLRHTFATVANSLGVSLYDIGKALGHSTPSTTGKVYTHMLDSTHEDTMTKIANVLK